MRGVVMQKLFKQVVGSVGLAMLALGVVHAGIANTKHNLSSSGTGSVISSGAEATTEICLFCHTPHMNQDKSDVIPLWNHTVSTATYTMYTSSTFDGSGTVQQIGDGSLTPATATVTNLCLSCHDGTVAISSLYNQSNMSTGGNTNPTMDTSVSQLNASGMLIGGTGALGTDLSNDHPVNFTYDAALVALDTTLHDPSSLNGVQLYGGKVQCASCHEPHVDYTTGTDTARSPFLRLPITGSVLCLECHNK
ncbi:Cytochrome c family protein [hydrothermal vent metagenome]|uniref:Cytochrome c family protein n=1 Tax=hydrothermal vent metagenome TaxID=652676 RepID=A0A3B1BX32_9ZZZZ